MRRVNESVRTVVAEGVRELKDPRIGMVTVTGVRVTRDLREATIYVSVLGGEKKRRATMAGLESAHGVLQTRINDQLSLKRTPQLSFEYDDSVERGVPARVTGADGLEAVRIAQACVESSRTGQVVQVAAQ